MRAAWMMAGLALAGGGGAAQAQTIATGGWAGLVPGVDAPRPMRGLRAEEGPTAPFGKRLARDFRVRSSTAGLFIGPNLIAPGGRVRQRIASSMFDLYPAGIENGFHFSGGVRYYSRVNFAIEAQNLTHGLLYSPNWRGSGGSRAGFRRFTPAATFGYTGVVGERMLVGVEAGGLMGPANSPAPRALERAMHMRGSDLAQPHGLNGIASFVVGLRF